MKNQKKAAPKKTTRRPSNKARVMEIEIEASGQLEKALAGAVERLVDGRLKQEIRMAGDQQANDSPKVVHQVDDRKGIPRAMDDLCAAQANLNEVWKHLRERLEPILRPVGPDACGVASGEAEQARSAVAEGITMAAYRSRRIEDEICEVLRRLELP